MKVFNLERFSKERVVRREGLSTKSDPQGIAGGYGQD